MHLLDDLGLVREVRLAHDRRVRNRNTLVTHFDGLRELRVLERHLHRLFGNHRLVFAAGHVVEVQARSGVELIDNELVFLFLAGHWVGFGDAERAFSGVILAYRVIDPVGQQVASACEVVERDRELLLRGVLPALNGNPRLIPCANASHCWRNRHFAEC